MLTIFNCYFNIVLIIFRNPVNKSVWSAILRNDEKDMKLRKFGLFTLLGLILAAIGIVAPIAWDWYKTKSVIELHHIANVRLVESSTLSKNIRISYNGRPTPVLSRHTFSIINAGRTPILKKDLVQPPTITFPNGVEILEVIEDAKNPKNLIVDYALSTKRDSVSISFPLLNPGDQSQFGVLLSGFTSDYSAHARIVGISKLTIVDSVEELRQVKRELPISVYVVLFIVMLLTFALAEGIFELIEENTIKAAIAGNKFEVPLYKARSDYLNFIRATFKKKTKSELKSIIEPVEAISPNLTLDESNHKQISQMVIEYAMKMNVGRVVLFFLILCIIGWGYVIISIIE